jgi:hypothetical protein
MMSHRILAASLVLATSSVAAAAGNVQVDVDSHRTVRLTGDELANSVQAVPGPTQRSMRIIGLGGTTIDGAPERLVPVARGLRADLGEGDDRIEVRDLTLRRDLRIKGEDGHDAAFVHGVVVRGRTSWIGGQGDDRLEIDGSCVFRRSMKLRGQRGRDVILIKGSRALGPLSIRGNSGDDDVVLRRMAVTENARTHIETGDGRDVVTFDTCTLNRIVIVGTGRSEDFVRVVDSHANADFRVGAGRADDRINLDDTTFNGDVRIDGDSGTDTLDLDGKVRFRGAEKRPEKYEVKLYSLERRR